MILTVFSKKPIWASAFQNTAVEPACGDKTILWNRPNQGRQRHALADPHMGLPLSGTGDGDDFFNRIPAGK